jgi:Chlorophyll A-B binding protein
MDVRTDACLRLCSHAVATSRIETYHFRACVCVCVLVFGTLGVYVDCLPTVIGIAMAATLGMLVQENYHFVGYLSPSSSLQFTDVPNGLAAGSVVPLMGWVQMAVVIGAHEFIVQPRPGKAPGDFGTGYFGIALDDQSAVQLRGLTVEVQNGRLYVAQ